MGDKCNATKKTGRTNVYDDAGRQIATVNGRGDRTTTVYDDAGQTVATIDALAYRTSQVYDPAGRRIELVDANDITVTFLFDAKGQDVGGIDALGNRVTYGYDGNGQQTLKIDPLGQRFSSVYDAVGRRTEQLFSDGRRHTFAFDSVGNQVRMEDSTGTTTSVYDAKNRVTAVINPGDRRVTNSYDVIDRRTVMIEPEGGRFSYSYDAGNRLTALINPQNKRTTQSFDVVDRLVRQQHGNGSLVTNIYDDAGQTTGVINAKSDGTVINRLTYTFDDAGNRLTKAESGGVRTTWAYDDTSQLVHEERNDANALDITHTYDPVGNRTVQIDSGVRTTATYDAGNQLSAENTAGARTTFTHDSCGNRTQKESPSATTFYTWDTCRNLTVVEPPAGKVTMTYNAAGKRMRKETSGDTKKFLYDFERLLQESDGADTVEKTYTSTQEQYGDLLSQYDGTDTAYHQYDAIGSTDALLSEAEMATDRYVYRAFGLETHTTGASDNALTFVGKDNYYRDSETDLYFLNARYYDPDAARFISEDPIGYEGGDVNLFRYVGNNPVNAVDPSGLQASCLQQAGQSNFQLAIDTGVAVATEWGRIRRSCSGALPGGVLGALGALRPDLGNLLQGGLDVLACPGQVIGDIRQRIRLALDCAAELGYSSISALYHAIQQGGVAFGRFLGIRPQDEPETTVDLVRLGRRIANSRCLHLLPIPASVRRTLTEGLDLREFAQLLNPARFIRRLINSEFWGNLLQLIFAQALQILQLLVFGLSGCNLGCVGEYLGAMISGIWAEFTKNPLGLIGEIICQMVLPYIGLNRELPEMIGRRISALCLAFRGDVRGSRDEMLRAESIGAGILERFTFWISLITSALILVGGVVGVVAKIVGIVTDVVISLAAGAVHTARVAVAIYDLCFENYPDEGPAPFSREEDAYLQAIAGLPTQQRNALEAMANGGPATAQGNAALAAIQGQVPAPPVNQELTGREKDCHDAAEGILNLAMTVVGATIGLATIGFVRVVGPWLRGAGRGIRMAAIAVRNIRIRSLRGVFRVISRVGRRVGRRGSRLICNTGVPVAICKKL